MEQLEHLEPVFTNFSLGASHEEKFWKKCSKGSNPSNNDRLPTALLGLSTTDAIRTGGSGAAGTRRTTSIPAKGNAEVIFRLSPDVTGGGRHPAQRRELASRWRSPKTLVEPGQRFSTFSARGGWIQARLRPPGAS